MIGRYRIDPLQAAVIAVAGIALFGGLPSLTSTAHNMSVSLGISQSDDPGDKWINKQKVAYHCAVTQRSYVEQADFFMKYMLGQGITVKTDPAPACEPA